MQRTSGAAIGRTLLSPQKTSERALHKSWGARSLFGTVLRREAGEGKLRRDGHLVSPSGESAREPRADEGRDSRRVR